MSITGSILKRVSCKEGVLFLVISLTVQSFFISAAIAGIVVFDDVVPVKKTIKIKALTKGRFFPEGGKLVTFYVEDKKIGTTLSGGDGYAFLKYTPSSAGIIALKVEGNGGTDRGVLLAMVPKDGLIIIEVENTLIEPGFSLNPVKNSSDSVQQFSKDFRILYVSSLMGIRQSRKWLGENGFPLSAVFNWDKGDVIHVLQERGIAIHAIIASPSLLAEVGEVPFRFSFRETENGTEVTDWNDLVKQLPGKDRKK
jgi:hypothetical protein